MLYLLSKISGWFLNAIISILLVADLITNWIMLNIADSQIANINANTSLIFSILILVCALVKIVLQIVIHYHIDNYGSYRDDCEVSMFFIIFFLVLFAIIGSLLIVRTLGWYNQLAFQVLNPTQWALSFFTAVWGGYVGFEITFLNDNNYWYHLDYKKKKFWDT